MRKLAALLCFTFAVLLFSAGEGFALPPCPEDQNQRFHNCFGAYITADGAKYVGEWRDDKQHGQGTHTFADGDKYVGEFRNGRYNGHFTVTYTDGDKYVGEFRDNKKHGQGTYTHADGRVKEGIFKDGKFQYARKDPKVEQRRKAEREAERRKQERIAREKREEKRQADNGKVIAAVSGTGFVVSKSGHIITNNHVINGCQEVKVHTKGDAL